MKRLRSMKLNAQLVAVFFIAVLLMSLGHFVVYAHLLSTMEEEEGIINWERMENVQMKLDAVFNESEKAALEILTSSSFQALAGAPMDDHSLVAVQQEAKKLLEEVEHISHWFIKIEGSDQLLTSNGISAPDVFLGGICKNDTYTQAFWNDRFLNNPGKFYYAATEYTCRGKTGKYEQITLMPMSFQSHYDRQLMVVVLLDVRRICKEDTYLESGAYFFSEDGNLLYTTDNVPKITTQPEGQTLDWEGEIYTVKSYHTSGPICVKLQGESEAANILHNNFLLCLIVAVAALAISALLIPRLVKNLLRPVDKMVDLVRQHAAPENSDLHGVSLELEQIIKSREQQAADLAQKNAALSEYRLHSRLKNVYVDMKAPEDQEEGAAYILYIQVQYLEKCLDSFTIPRAELENCLQEMMGTTLQKIFASAMIFQLEPGRFAARVAMAAQQEDMQAAMDAFMRRLEQEKEFACFTVVYSRRLEKEEQLAEVYDDVRNVARYARVCNRSQLISQENSSEDTAFIYSKAEEQKLDSLVRQGKIPQAVMLAEKILQQNVEDGISRAQMEILCVAVVNTVAYAAAAVSADVQKNMAASVIYNALATRCLGFEDYRTTVEEYIRSVEVVEEAPAESEQLLGKVRLYMQENYHKEFSVEEMASALWVSRSYLSSYYKNKTGNNLSDSIQEYRIGKAKELLLDPDVKISDVGTMVGISSSNTFLRQFRKYTGTTPREYRQQHSL